MQQKQLCNCGGTMKVVLSRRQLIAKCDRCGRTKAATEKPRPVKRPA